MKCTGGYHGNVLDVLGCGVATRFFCLGLAKEYDKSYEHVCVGAFLHWPRILEFGHPGEPWIARR